jgi:8-hydroxy-5-deazaflavin:NADPH oxidoreductase
LVATDPEGPRPTSPGPTRADLRHPRELRRAANPLDPETFDALVPAPHSSSAADLAAALPSSRVLKAFNTNLAPTLRAKQVGPNKTTVLVAGDDADAKAALISAVQAGSLDALDVGPLARARELEALGFLQIKLAVTEQIDWTGGFTVVR